MEICLGRPVEHLRILEIGPGQGLQRALYFGMKNEVIGVDLDVIQRKISLRDYLIMARKNGMGRVLKTIGFRLITQPPIEKAWKKILATQQLPYPRVLYADICQAAPEAEGFDLVTSWSVFEHLPDPALALKNVLRSLCSGGVFFISIHLFTSKNGHHDIRGFEGGSGKLPIWGHLRPETADQFHPSAYLNRWRLEDWRKLFSREAPGFEEVLERGEDYDELREKLTGPLREELKNYSDPELLSINAVYLWKKL